MLLSASVHTTDRLICMEVKSTPSFQWILYRLFVTKGMAHASAGSDRCLNGIEEYFVLSL